MKTTLTVAALAFILSSCAPGAFTRSSGVPLGVGEVWTLETTNSLTKQPLTLEIRVSGVSQPASRVGNAGAYLIGPYAITYRGAVTDVEWFEQYSSARYLLFYTSRLGGVNSMTLDIDRAFSERATSCEFRGWSYGASRYSGTHFAITTSGGSAFSSPVGTCVLTRKP